MGKDKRRVYAGDCEGCGKRIYWVCEGVARERANDCFLHIEELDPKSISFIANVTRYTENRYYCRTCYKTLKTAGMLI